MEKLLSRLFVLVCMAVISLMMCLIGLSLFDLSLPLTIATGTILFAAMVLLQSQYELRRDMSGLKNQRFHLNDKEGDIQKRVERLIVETEASAQTATEAVEQEIALLRGDVSQLRERLRAIEHDNNNKTGAPAPADRIMDHAAELAAAARQTASPQSPDGKEKARPRLTESLINETAAQLTERFRISQPAPRARSADVRPEPASQARDAGAAAGQRRSKRNTGLSPLKLKTAIEKDKLNLHLQPIVSLPAREPSFYEAFMRLQQDDGSYVDASELMALASDNGLASLIEKKVLFSSVRMLQTLSGLKNQMGLFCAIPLNGLQDARGFRELRSFLEKNMDLRTSLVLQVAQEDYQAFGAMERERLAEIADLGFSLCLDKITDLELDPRALRANGFGYVKAAASTLLASSFVPENMGSPSDIGRYLAGRNLSLIASGLVDEVEALDLLDYDAAYGQGDLFAPARAVKPELLRSPEEKDGGSEPPRPRAMSA